MLDLLGFKQTRNPAVFQVHGHNGFAQIALTQEEGNRRGFPGAGGIHHVAFRVTDDDELNAFEQLLKERGLQSSRGFVDRYYFHSLYFREPGGVLFELATDGPGMDRDELPGELGEKLSIPPFLEPKRAEIEANLKPLPPPAYSEKVNRLQSTVRVFMSVDIEGCTGIASFSQCSRPNPAHFDWPFARRMLHHDVNAAHSTRAGQGRPAA